MHGLRARLVAAGVIVALAVIGTAAAGYVLVNQRLPVPFRDVYDVRATLVAADGVAPGVGQAVQVSGVKVGTVKAARLVGARAMVTLEIDRRQLPAVHADARVHLRPITPVKDMQIDLEPGDRPARPLPPGGEIPAARTTTPVPLGDLLSTLDGDTRTFLTSMLVGLGQGTEGRAPDIRRLLVALGPTTAEVRRISTALERRRRSLARLVHNVAGVVTAAASDERLAELVVDGRRTLEVIARHDAPVRRALATMPSALRTADEALRSLARLTDETRPTLRALTPAVRQLPRTLERSMRPVADEITVRTRRQIRPLVRDAIPLARDLQQPIAGLPGLLPQLSRVAQSVNYVLNAVSYNPPGKEEGMLMWFPWFAHNWLTASSTADAHGSLVRGALFFDCKTLTNFVDLGPLFRAVLGNADPCGRD
ncbi:MAG: MlaD family protein [Solirubrobacteraceae bacterium]